MAHLQSEMDYIPNLYFLVLLMPGGSAGGNGFSSPGSRNPDGTKRTVPPFPAVGILMERKGPSLRSSRRQWVFQSGQSES